MNDETKKRIRALASAATPNLCVGLFASDNQKKQVAMFKESLEKRPEGKVWCCCAEIPGKPISEEALYAAITGNGPTSEANARFFAVARELVLSLLQQLDECDSEVDDLKAELKYRESHVRDI